MCIFFVFLWCSVVWVLLPAGHVASKYMHMVVSFSTLHPDLTNFLYIQQYHTCSSIAVERLAILVLDFRYLESH